MGQNYVISTVLSFFLICVLPIDGSSQDTAQIFSEIRTGIVHIGVKSNKEGVESIEVCKWLGTGFTVDSECTFATAKHVLNRIDPSSIVVRFHIPGKKTRTFPAKILHEDVEKDVSFIKIDLFNNQPCITRNLYIFRLASSISPSIAGESIIIVGHPKIANKDIDIPIARKGIVASAEIKWAGENMLLLDLTGVPGFSGSPVVLEKTREVIGKIFGPGPTSRAYGFEWATPITMNDYKNAITSNSDQ